MAKIFVDAAVKTEQEAMALEDGSALDLDNKVRVLYDDTLEKHAIAVLLERIKHAILRLEPQ